jgi:integrase
MGRDRLASRKNFPNNLYLNSNGYYYFRNPANGKKKGLGSDKAHAFREARAANAVLATMKPSDLVSWVSGTKSYTLEQWVPEYKDLWIKKSSPAEQTLRNHSRYLERIAAASFAWMPLKDITTEHAALFLDAVREESGDGAVINLRSRLKDLFRMAITRGLIPTGSNPVSDTYKPTGTTTKERLSIEQFLLIRGKAPSWMVNAMNLALVTGQRREDITNMKFTDYVDGKLQVVQGKGQGRVRIKIAGTLTIAALGMSLDEAIQQCRDGVASEYLVHHPVKKGRCTVGGQIVPDGLSRAFVTARESVGIVAAEGRTPPTFHEVRSLSERLYRTARSGEFAQKLLGHSNPSTTSMYDSLRGTGWEEVG